MFQKGKIKGTSQHLKVSIKNSPHYSSISGQKSAIERLLVVAPLQLFPHEIRDG